MEILDADTIAKVAAALADRLEGPHYLRYLLTAAIAFIVTALGSYAGAYIRERGKQKALETRFDTALQQMKLQTSATEQVKNEVKARFDDKAVMERLYREKLECIFAGLFSLTHWFDENRNKAVCGQVFSSADGPIVAIEMLHNLYFVDCQGSYIGFKHAFLAYDSWIIQQLTATLNARGLGQPTAPADAAGFRAVFNDYTTASDTYRNDLIERYGPRAAIPATPTPPG